MKKRNLIALGATLFLAVGLYAQTAEISDGIILWKGSKIVPDSHEGTLNISKGALTFEGDTLTGGTFTVDMNSMVSTDLSGSYAQKLIGHLKSDDFFAVAEHPEATLTFSSAIPTEGGYKVTGDFTIRGITHPETFILKFDGNKATADLEIDRSKYNVKYASGSFFENLGDKLIKDALELSVSFTY
jgi:polyisoprenoid-binding protein YceI